MIRRPTNIPAMPREAAIAPMQNSDIVLDDKPAIAPSVAVDGQSAELGQDLLFGAEAIAKFVFGDRKYRRRIYHLASSSRLPVFRLGAMLCGRKSVLLSYVTEQERRIGG